MKRRDFLKLSGMGVAAAGTCNFSYGAPTILEADVIDKYAKLIPADKGLDPVWVRSLTTRGELTVVKDRKALEHIGMPVGGLFAGTVYLGGDGRLWLWNIFNSDPEGIEPRKVMYKGKQVVIRDGGNYIDPAPRIYPFEQNFAVRIGDKVRTLDSDGFDDVSFVGQYPIGEVKYTADNCPLSVQLSAFSPFIPLNTPDSTLPATVMSFRVRNTASKTVEADIVGWMSNPICLHSAKKTNGLRNNRIINDKSFTALSCTASPAKPDANKRPDMVFEEFEQPDYGNWVVTGTAFGSGPILVSDIPDYQGDLGAMGKRVVNSHASAPGSSCGEKDAATGTLTSPLFKVSRRFINVLVGGGNHKGRTCVNLIVGGKVVDSITGNNSNRMSWKSFNTTQWDGQEAQLQIVDNDSGDWGNIGVDSIVFSDKPAQETKLETLPDFGSMALSVLSGTSDTVLAAADTQSPQPLTSDSTRVSNSRLTDNRTGSVGQRLTLKPGEERTVNFVITWHFPNLSVYNMKNVGREYASRFENALGVARYVVKNFARLSGETRLWRDTWYDSSLPYWFLDKTMSNTTTLATTTAYRFRDGRFWAWEGIGCCHGTCTHVWHYAQSPGRLFPDVERRQREEVDFGVAMHPDGGIGMRAGLKGSNYPADDGQCGRILGAYREHQMSKDNAFLTRTWPRIKKAILFMINRDKNRDGILEGAQHNTLDAAWYGRIPFLATLYLATLRAGTEMATEMGDHDFAKQCRTIADKGAQTIMELYNGEYFIQELDPSHIDDVATGNGCYIDQVLGQFWSDQVGLGYLFDKNALHSALKSLYKYNFVPNIGKFRDVFTRGRWYAMDDDKGLIMCSWPKGGLNKKWYKSWQFMYFNECMSGFEWQAAASMIAEGMIEEGMAISRAIHDRYSAELRNPYNEIECSDHYARAMASYGAFLAACGYETHGPKKHLGFAPRLTPHNFKAPFTAAEGWGTYSQDSRSAQVAVKWGVVELKTLGISIPKSHGLRATLDGRRVLCQIKRRGEKTLVVFADPVTIKAGSVLKLS